MRTSSKFFSQAKNLFHSHKEQIVSVSAMGAVSIVTLSTLFNMKGQPPTVDTDGSKSTRYKPPCIGSR